MPNTFEQVQQNGHAWQTGQGYPPSQLHLKVYTPEPSISLADEGDWSILTQDAIDTVPQAWTRGLLYLLVMFAAIILPWAMLSKVDEVGSARGRLEPKGKTFTLDAPVEGTVAEIKVKEGQPVKAGQILLELESELAQAELQQAQARLEGQLNRVSQLEFMKNQLLGVTIRAQQQQGLAEAASQLAQVDEARQQLNSNRKARALASVRLARDLVEVRRYQRLVAQGIVPEIKLVEVQRTMDETRLSLNQADAEVQQAEQQIVVRQNRYQSTVRANQVTILETQQRTNELETQLAEARSQINQTKQQIAALKFQLQQREVRAPIDGTLFQLPIQRAGAVVQPGQMVAQIAPQKAPLVLRAQMGNQESGFLKVGMPVKVKFDAYPFQDYGIVEGRVSWVSPDSKIVETAQGNAEIFELEITLNQSYIQAANQRITLNPGQTATAEVIVRQRRIVDFLLDPFKKLQTGGLNL
ncbi:MAG: HlyD family type I secretion periplasmic adaptor subunit [Leptolyngbyaceae cyanobacterium RU_5_1]|nr:HlyD family type I secretion periplasmic adaptor subunit [Leptolyngbyaceae cyanobacterium RU_5_1]